MNLKSLSDPTTEVTDDEVVLSLAVSEEDDNRQMVLSAACSCNPSAAPDERQEETSAAAMDMIGVLLQMNAHLIIDLILEHLSPEDLKCCRLVNKTWHHLSTSHLLPQTKHRLMKHAGRLSHRWSQGSFVDKRLTTNPDISLIDIISHDRTTAVVSLSRFGGGGVSQKNALRLNVHCNGMKLDSSGAAFDDDDSEACSFSTNLSAANKFILAAIFTSNRNSSCIKLPVWKLDSTSGSSRRSKPGQQTTTTTTLTLLSSRLTFGLPDPGICRHTWHPLMSDLVCRKPLVLSCFGETFFSMPIAKFANEKLYHFIYDIWHIHEKGCSRIGTTTVKAPSSLPSDFRAECCRVISDTKLYDLVAYCGGSGSHSGSLLCAFRGEKVWSVKAPSGHGGCPFVCFVGVSQVGVAWMTGSDSSCGIFSLIQVLDVHTGVVVGQVDVGNVFSRIWKVQVVSGRMAVCGWMITSSVGQSGNDVIVWDLYTQKILFRGSKMLEIQDGGNKGREKVTPAFLLTQSKLVFNTVKLAEKGQQITTTRIIDHW